MMTYWVVVNSYTHNVWGPFRSKGDAASYRLKKEKAADRSVRVMPGDFDVRKLRTTSYYDDTYFVHEYE